MLSAASTACTSNSGLAGRGGFVDAKALPFENLAAQIQAGKIVVADFQLLRPAAAPAGCAKNRRPIGQTAVEHVFAGMAERRMPQVVDQGQRLDQIFVQSQRPADGPRDTGHFQRVGQPGAMIIAQFAGEDLRLEAQAAIGRSVHDPIAIALERPPIGMLAARDICDRPIGCCAGHTGPTAHARARRSTDCRMPGGWGYRPWAK